MSLIHYWRLAALIALAACSGGQPNGEGDEPSAPVAVIESASEDYMAENSEPSLPPSPFTKTVVTNKISPAYLDEWQKAANRHTCAIIALPNDAVSQHKGAKAHRVDAAGGWAVAYDLPDLDSAYGIPGMGMKADAASQWHNKLTWDDSSTAGFGLVNGDSPNYQANVHVAGQECDYNVWSAISEEHLEQMLNDLRKLDVDALNVKH